MLSVHINTEYSYISPYSVMILLSFIIGLLAQFVLNIKSGVEKRFTIYLTALSLLLSMELGLALTYVTSKGNGFGLSSIGGLAGMYAAALIIGAISRDRYSAKAMLDNCTLILPLMYSVSKVGCLLGGCCCGRSYHGPCCIEYTRHGVVSDGVFPVQLAETVVFFVIFIIGITMARKRKKNAVLIVFVSSASAKFLLDFLRYSHRNCEISTNQSLCLIMLLIVTVAIIVKKCRKQSLS